MLMIDDANAMSKLSAMRLRSGLPIVVRVVEQRDATPLQDYIRNLSVLSRYSRMLGAASELPPSELQAILHPVDADHVALIATIVIEGVEQTVGEARLVYDPEVETVELALSVDDHWQKTGVGTALLDELLRRAATLGPVDVFGDTLRSNNAMLGLARKSGFALKPVPADWRLVRFHKSLDYRGKLTPEIADQQIFLAL